MSASFLPAIGGPPAPTGDVDVAQLMGDTLLRLISELPGGGEASLDAQGRISFNSFKTAVVSLGLATTEARRIFDHFDPGGTGYINFSELRAEVRATATSLSHTLLLIHGRGEERARARMPRAPRSHVCVFVARLSYRS